MLKKLPLTRWDRAAAAHLLGRAGFGGAPGEIDELHRRGLDGAVGWLVDCASEPDVGPQPKAAEPGESEMEMYRRVRDATEDERRKAAQMKRQDEAARIFDLRQWWLERMRTTRRPLQEKLTLFWHGHFATSVRKVRSANLMWRQNETFRRHASGNWEAMLVDVSKDPAMVRWLDNATNNKQKPNENYARELMELFTLGEGHYTEEDIRESARAFTGWSLNRRTGEFLFMPAGHDSGEKTFLGSTGSWDGTDIVRLILGQPRAAEFIAEKIWRFFASENAPPEVVSPLAATLRGAKHEFKPLLREMFLSEAFYSEKAVRTQIKSPVAWLIAAVKALDLPLPPARLASAALDTLGQSLFDPPNVKGWDGGIAWITTANLLNRYNYARGLVFGAAAGGGGGRGFLAASLPGAGNPQMDRMRERLEKAPPEARARYEEKLRRFAQSSYPGPDIARMAPNELRAEPPRLVGVLADRLYFVPPPEKDRERFLNFVQKEASSPPTDDDVRGLLHLMMSSPHYQLI